MRPALCRDDARAMQRKARQNSETRVAAGSVGWKGRSGQMDDNQLGAETKASCASKARRGRCGLQESNKQGVARPD